MKRKIMIFVLVSMAVFFTGMSHAVAGDWVDKGYFASNYADAPLINGEGPSPPTAVTWVPATSKYLTIKGQYYWWCLRNGDGTLDWNQGYGTLSAAIVDAPTVDGIKPGMVNAAFYHNGNICLIRGSKYWYISYSGVWGDAGRLDVCWANAPVVGGTKPFYPDAVAYLANLDMALIIQGDKFWYCRENGATTEWPHHGYLSSLWHDAPAFSDGSLPHGSIRAMYYFNADYLCIMSGGKYWVRKSRAPGAGPDLSEGGGGIRCDSASPTLINCILSENEAQTGGGIACYGDSSPRITNCTFGGNTTVHLGTGLYTEAGSSPLITNSIIWENGSVQVYRNPGGSGVPQITYSDVKNGYTGTGNINSDPLFIGTGDYHITGGSPCRDTATAVGAPDKDVDGHGRPYGSGVDMGADEYDATVFTTHVITAGANANGSILPSGSIDILEGRTISFSVKANPGCRITDIVVDNVSMGPHGSYTFHNVTAHHTITAVFEEEPGMTVPPGTPGGQIPSGDGYDMTRWGQVGDVAVKWQEGGAPAVDGVYPYSGAGPDAIAFDNRTGKGIVVNGDCYWIGTWDGQWLESGYLNTLWSNVNPVDSQYPFDGITAMNYTNGLLYVLKGDLYWVISGTTCTEQGRLSDVWSLGPEKAVDGVLPIDNGGPTAIAFEPELQRWLIINNDRYWYLYMGTLWLQKGYLADIWDAPENEAAYPTSGVTSAYFNNNVLCIMKNNLYWLATLPESYQITVQAAENGTVFPVGAYRVCRGESLGITMAPDAGYALQQGFVDDQRIGSAPFYKLVDVAADHVVRAEFAPEDLVDTNADGLPDPWQLEKFGAIDCATCGAMDNPDGDGLNNLSEYNLGSDPTVDDVAGAGIYYEYDALGRIKKITRVPTAQ